MNHWGAKLRCNQDFAKLAWCLYHSTPVSGDHAAADIALNSGVKTCLSFASLRKVLSSSDLPGECFPPLASDHFLSRALNTAKFSRQNNQTANAYSKPSRPAAAEKRDRSFVRRAGGNLRLELEFSSPVHVVKSAGPIGSRRCGTAARLKSVRSANCGAFTGALSSRRTLFRNVSKLRLDNFQMSPAPKVKRSAAPPRPPSAPPLSVRSSLKFSGRLKGSTGVSSVFDSMRDSTYEECTCILPHDSIDHARGINAHDWVSHRPRRCL
jgi:hypothetical protein